MENKDKIVEQLQNTLKLKKAEIAKIERADYKTNMTLNIGNGPVNLNTCSDINILVSLLGTLINNSYGFTKATNAVGLDWELDNCDFKHQGYSLNDWTNDIKIRVGKVSIAKKRKELEELETRLGKLESKELREKRELEELQRLIQGNE